MTLNRFYNFKQNLNKMFLSESVGQYFHQFFSRISHFLIQKYFYKCCKTLWQSDFKKHKENV